MPASEKTTKSNAPVPAQGASKDTFFRKPGEGFFDQSDKALFGPKKADPFFKPRVQAKLSVNEPGDAHEKEADAVADKVMRMPVAPGPGPAAPLAEKNKEEELQAKGEGTPEVTSGFEQSLQSSKGGGSPLPDGVKTHMETGIGADFSNVRVHTGLHAAELSSSIQAQAFTHGSDIYFNEGKYSPGTDSGKHLLAHELTHTVQQGAAGVQRQVQRDPETDLVPSIEERAQMLYDAFEYKAMGIFEATDEDKVYEALKGISGWHRQKLIDYYDAHYKSLRDNRGLIEDIRYEMSEEPSEMFKALELALPSNSSVGRVTEENAILIVAKTWIKPVHPFTMLGNRIEYQCEYRPAGNGLYFMAPGSHFSGPKVRVVYMRYPNGAVRDITIPRGYGRGIDHFTKYRDKGGKRVITSFSVPAGAVGDYEFMFFIEKEHGEQEIFIERHEVKPITAVGRNAVNENTPQGYKDFRQQVAFTGLSLADSGSKDQKNDTAYIELAFGDNPERSFYAPGHVYNAHYRLKLGPHVSQAKRYIWFAELQKDISQAKDFDRSYSSGYFGHKYIHIMGIDALAMGDGASMESAFPITDPGVHIIHCIEADAGGNPTGIHAMYRHVIQSEEANAQLQAFKKYRSDIDVAFNRMIESTVIPVNAVHVNEKNYKVTPLNIFAGKSKSDPTQVVFADLTPGVTHKRYYEGANSIDDFRKSNEYPTGIVSFQIPANTLGIPVISSSFKTDGASFWASLSSETGWASLGLAVAGAVASFTPAAPIAPFLFIAAGAAGVVSGSADWIDRMEKGTVTTESITLDVITIASSFIGMGSAVSRLSAKAASFMVSGVGRCVLMADLALNVGAGLIITVEALEEIQKISADPNMPTSKKIDQIVQKLASIALIGGLLVMSAKGAKAPDWAALESKIFAKLSSSVKADILKDMMTVMRNSGDDGLVLANRIANGKFESIDGFIKLVKSASVDTHSIKAINQALDKAETLMALGTKRKNLRFEDSFDHPKQGYDIDLGVIDEKIPGAYKEVYQFKTNTEPLTKQGIQKASRQLVSAKAEKRIVEFSLAPSDNLKAIMANEELKKEFTFQLYEKGLKQQNNVIINEFHLKFRNGEYARVVYQNNALKFIY